MTANLTDRYVALVSRPKGVPTADHFEVREGPVADPGEGEVVIRNLFWSVDPAMRGWVNAAANYSEPVAIGDAMRSFAVGEIVASRAPGYAVGEIVTGLFGWRRYSVVAASSIDRKVTEEGLSPSLAVGVLGLNGVTAYFGLMDVCAAKPGDTVVVSTAAGSVGSAVGQIAKITGCRTIGIAGGSEKARQCREEFGYDSAIDYRGEDVAARLAEFAPDGVDCYFDNTCGPISDAVMTRLAPGARIAICGTAALTDWDPIPQGPRVNRQLLVARARMQGFLVLDYRDRYAEAVEALAGWVRDGRLAYREHILEGADAAPGAIEMLYQSRNEGKLLVRVD